jgi:S-adenosylmethionine:tRNA ribosyltransferase-isomerase
MFAASTPSQRPPDAKLLHVTARGTMNVLPRSRWTDVLRSGDLVVANDAATLPASLHGTHARTGAAIEIRLASRSETQRNQFTVVAFGAGDYHTRTEDRPLPPQFSMGDELVLGPLRAEVVAILDHPRLLAVRMKGSSAQIWSGIAAHGRPIQYAHLTTDLQLWDVWTPIAAAPVAFEPPSAAFALDWRSLAAMKRRGIGFATLTHAAGISSTGDAQLDGRLPFDEPYSISARTAAAVNRALDQRCRIVAIGTTVVRALEHAGRATGSIAAGRNVANQRLGTESELQVVSAILSGTHEPGTSHYQLLQAFAQPPVIERMDEILDAHEFRTHEFGDSVLLERQIPAQLRALEDTAATSVFACNLRGHQEKIAGCCAA